MIVRCATCHREERWEGADRAVVLPGGARRPDVPAPLAAWQVLRESFAGRADPVVGACPSCAQPLLAAGGRAVPFTVSTPKGDVVVARDIQGPAGVLDEAAADAFIRSQYPASLLPSRHDAVGTLMVLPMLAVVALWCFSGAVIMTFMTGSLGRVGLAYPILLCLALFIGVTAWFSRRNER